MVVGDPKLIKTEKKEEAKRGSRKDEEDEALGYVVR